MAWFDSVCVTAARRWRCRTRLERDFVGLGPGTSGSGKIPLLDQGTLLAATPLGLVGGWLIGLWSELFHTFNTFECGAHHAPGNNALWWVVLHFRR